MTTLRGTCNRHPVRLIALLAVLGFVVAAHGGAAASVGARHSTSSVAVKTRNIKRLGVVLVDAKGRTLYTFAPDKHRRVTCTGQCAHYWPPLKWKGSSRPRAGGSAKTKQLGLDENPAGGRVVTYHEWPLYTYLGDGAAGQANGQNTRLNGGKWYVISPTGRVIKHSA